jgi:hypothetical protein
MMRKALAVIRIVSLAAALAGDGACGGSNPGPIAPTAVTAAVPPNGHGTGYTISGTISEYHGGPVAGAHVVLFSCIGCNAVTDAQGHYTIATPSADPTSLGVWKDGYQDGPSPLCPGRDCRRHHRRRRVHGGRRRPFGMLARQSLSRSSKPEVEPPGRPTVSLSN